MPKLGDMSTSIYCSRIITAGVYSEVKVQASISQVGHVLIGCVDHGEHSENLLQCKGGVNLFYLLITLQSSNTRKSKM